MICALAQAENFEAMGSYMFDPDEPGQPEKPITFADFLKKVLSMRSSRHAGSASGLHFWLAAEWASGQRLHTLHPCF